MIEIANRVLLFSKAWDVPATFIEYIESLDRWRQHSDIGQMSEDGNPLAHFSFFHDKELNQDFLSTYKKACKDSINTYATLFFNKRPDIDLDSLEVKKYDEGGFYESHQHNPDDPDMSKKTKVVSYINDNYDGGELVFSDYGVEHKPSAGDILVFPSDYWIEVKPSTNGIKYVVMDVIQI